MTVAAVVFAVLAGWWAFPRQPRVPAPAVIEAARPGRRLRLPLLAVGVVAAIWFLAGPVVAVPVTAAGIAAVTVIRVSALRSRGRRTRQAAADVARACTVLATELELGRVPTAALTAAAGDCPVLAPAATVAHIGGNVIQTWERQATEPGHEGLLVLGRAWRVADVTGAPLATSLAAVAAALSSQEEVDRMIAGELAAPRMTGVVLALLPIAGVGLGYAIGGDPLGFLLTTPWGWVCLVAGTALACAGLLWTEQLAGHG